MKSIVRVLFLLLVLFWALPIAAKQAVSNTNNCLTGKVLDATSKQGLPFASVAIFKQVEGKDSLLTGSQTDEQGAFVVTTVSMGTLIVRVTFVGYQTLDQLTRISQNQTDLGTLMLKPDAGRISRLVIRPYDLSLLIPPRLIIRKPGWSELAGYRLLYLRRSYHQTVYPTVSHGFFCTCHYVYQRKSRHPLWV